jgi:hypothetical protein
MKLNNFVKYIKYILFLFLYLFHSKTYHDFKIQCCIVFSINFDEIDNFHIYTCTIKNCDF